MKISPVSRRMFLLGAGASLAIPLLPSLLPSSAHAAPVAVAPRYIQILNPYSPTSKMFFGDIETNQRIAPHVNVRKLTEVQGPISRLIGTEFDALRNKFSLLRGLDVQAENANHQFCFATCASSYAAGVDNDEQPPASGQASVDSILAASSRVYGADSNIPAVRRVLNLNPFDSDDYSRNRSFSWRRNETNVEIARPTKQTQALFDALGTGFGTNAAAMARDQRLVDAVYTDFKSVRDSRRISATDRAKLDAYMALVADINKGAGTCTEPQRGAENDPDAILDNQLRLLVAALACDLTRVASITLGMTAGYGTCHSEHHAVQDDSTTGLVNDFVQHGKRVAKLMTMLDAVTDVGGNTLLDNSLVYWNMQYGCAVGYDQHRPRNMPVLVGGGAGGTMRQGHFVDYLKEDPTGTPVHGRVGMVMNNLLVTFMNSMGVGSSEYETTPGQGYGAYQPNGFDDRVDASYWQSTEGRRAPLPFVYTGVPLG